MKNILSLCFSFALLCCFSVTAVHAAAPQYRFGPQNNNDFYRSTCYETIHGSEYNYGGPNVVDFYDVTKLPGLVTLTPQTAPSIGTDVRVDPDAYDVSGQFAPSFNTFTTPVSTPFTPASQLRRQDGSIGTLTIPTLGIHMNVFQGATEESMARGLGHFSDTSGWNGNVGLSGHNRGSAFNIGSIRNLRNGDVIAYTTSLGTRHYAVTFVGTISSTNWSYLAASVDNRITIITCVNDRPDLRIVVQAREIV